MSKSSTGDRADRAHYVGDAVNKPPPLRSAAVKRKPTSRSETSPTVTEFVGNLFSRAKTEGSSDIHIEPNKQECTIRIRIDGLLRSIQTISLDFSIRVVSQLKILAEMDISERRLPQDGRLTLETAENLDIDVRLSTLPTVWGEKVVLRLIGDPVLNKDLRSMGMSAAQAAQVALEINRPNGLALVTGPTGSGKSQTLYTSLELLDRTTRNISTIEDPIECLLPGINQTAVNPRIGLTFEKGLRTLLRQDPDVIMVGEVRDTATASTLISAALTGHFVLSTLHTRSALEAVDRLGQLGIPAYHIAAVCSLFIAQRLVRKLCGLCRVADKRNWDPHVPQLALNNSRESVEAYPDAGSLIFRANPKGCPQCWEGYSGRSGVFEIVAVSPQLANLITSRKTLSAMQNQMNEEGQQSLYTAGLEAVHLGTTSMDELARIIGFPTQATH